MRQDLNNTSLVDLCDMLVTKTQELLKAIEKKEINGNLKDLKTEVEEIQAAIQSKKE